MIDRAYQYMIEPANDTTRIRFTIKIPV